jgi:hypothetical protein
MEMPELHSRLLEERGIPPLIALCCNDGKNTIQITLFSSFSGHCSYFYIIHFVLILLDVNSRGEACRCVANLSVNPDMHQILIKEGNYRYILFNSLHRQCVGLNSQPSYIPIMLQNTSLAHKCT